MRYIIFSFIVIGLLTYCKLEEQPEGQAPKFQTITDSLVFVGEKIARAHCVGCHQFPKPDLLDKETWVQQVLPRMGVLLGMVPEESLGYEFIEPAVRPVVYSNKRVYRYEATLAKNDWEAIKKYYAELAPDSLEVPAINLKKDLPLFKAKFPNIHLSPPSTTMIKIRNKKIFIGDANTKRLFQFDESLNPIDAANAQEGVVAMEELEEGYVITSMGAFSPTDLPKGMTFFLPKEKDKQSFIMADQLRRPVHSAMADLDGDELHDLITCEYGKWTGQLTWWKNDGKGNFDRRLLRDMPGAIRAYPKDMNNDGKMDVVALFGQGDEGIFIFYNKGNNIFQEERVLSFPASYGSSYFNLADFNGDGHLDIIYTCGDNADYTPVTKPYHGIRIFENSGNNTFTETLFQPLPGAYAAHAKDFDQDGDLDIAACSFFPDYGKQNETGFVFFENINNNFKAATFPHVNRGRWLVMDSADFDGDGDEDIVLGSLAFEVIPKQGLMEEWTELGIPFILLENQYISK